MPAATGLRSSQKNIVTSIAAVMSELWPEITHRTAAGERISASRRWLSVTCARATAMNSAALRTIQTSSACR